MRRNGWLVFAAWLLAGALAVFSLLAAASIGLFVAPFAALAIWLTLRSGGAGPEMLGMVSGACAVCLLIALLSWLEGTTPWLVAGLLLVAAGVGAYVLMRRGTFRGGPFLDADDTPT